MKKILSFSMLLLSCGWAMAGDLPRDRLRAPAAPSPLSGERVSAWSGLYAGVHAGTIGGDVTDANLDPITNVDLSPIRGKLHRSGGLGGFQVGYGFQVGQIAFGVEADLGLTNLKGKQEANGSFNGAAAAARLDASTTTWGALRGRVGYVFDNSLVYGTGGVASGWQKSGFMTVTQVGGAAVTGAGASANLRAGWILGGGVEHIFLPGVSGKLEYLYAYLADGIRGGSNPNGLHLYRAGVNYHF